MRRTSSSAATALHDPIASEPDNSTSASVRGWWALEAPLYRRNMVSVANRAATLGELRAIGWQSVPVKEEIRANAVARIAAGQPLFEGVLGYEQTVMPQLENALLAGHDVIFLGERGQARTQR